MSELTEDEVALYDRQIRLWGVEAQSKIRNSKVLVYNIRGIGVEVSKNIVLSGVGNIHILDPHSISLSDLSANFFLTPDDLGKSRGEVSSRRIKELNPLFVGVSHEIASIDEKDDLFFKQFHVLVLSDLSLSSLRRVNEISRKFDIPLYYCGANGFDGFIFIDLNNHFYLNQKEIKQIKSASINEIIENVDWTSSSLRRISKLYFAYSLFLKYEDSTKELNEKDLIDFKDNFIRQKFPKLDSSFVPNSILSSLLHSNKKDLSPISAILGGIIGQEIIKVLSKNSEPLYNCFLFDGRQSRGTIDKLFPTV